MEHIFNHLLPNRRGEVCEAEVPAAAPALTNDALRRRVQRGQHRVRVVRRRQPKHHFPEAQETLSRRVHVLLVHLVRHQHNAAVAAEFRHSLHHVAIQHAASRVP
ncbi:alanine transaminase, partial [Trypanosoma cruzi]